MGKKNQHDPPAAGSALIPAYPEPPRPYTPPVSPRWRPVKPVEWAGFAFLVCIVLFVLTWLTTRPAAGEPRYWQMLLSGQLVPGETGVAPEPAGDASHES